MTLKVKKSSTLDILGSPVPRRKKKKKIESIYACMYLYIFISIFYVKILYHIYAISYVTSYTSYGLYFTI